MDTLQTWLAAVRSCPDVMLHAELLSLFAWLHEADHDLAARQVHEVLRHLEFAEDVFQGEALDEAKAMAREDVAAVLREAVGLELRLHNPPDD